MRYHYQLIVMFICIPLIFAFEFVGIFVNGCYVGFMRGWKQSWFTERRENE